MSERRLLFRKEDNGKPIELYENGPVQEVYVDGIQGLIVGNNAVKWNFFSRGFDGDDDDAEVREVNTRVVCSVETFMSISKFFGEMAEELKKASDEESSKE